MFTIASYIKILKNHAKNKSISTEEFTRAIFEILINHYDIKNQRGGSLDLDKSRISKIMSGKSDVPQAIRAVLAYADIENVAKIGFEDFSADYLDKASISDAVNQIDKLLKKDNTISLSEKTALCKKRNDPIQYLSNAFIIAVKTDNTATKEKNTLLWSRGNNSVELIFGDLFRFCFDNRCKRKNIIVIPVNTAFDTHISFNAEKMPFPLFPKTPYTDNG